MAVGPHFELFVDKFIIRRTIDDSQINWLFVWTDAHL